MRKTCKTYLNLQLAYTLRYNPPTGAAHLTRGEKRPNMNTESILRMKKENLASFEKSMNQEMKYANKARRAVLQSMLENFKKDIAALEAKNAN